MQQQIIDDLGFCPSFNCYSSDSQPSSSAAVKISHQLQQEEEFEFSLVIGDEALTAEALNSDDRTVFPLFNRDLLIQKDVDREIACTTSLEKLFITERDGSGSTSSSESEADDSENEAPAVFCVWRHKLDGGASPLSKCKKSSSTGSGSKRWRIRDLLRRSNSEGKDPMVLLTNNNNNKKVEIPKRKLNSGESKPSIHEYYYVQQRAEREGVKRKSYLPYRQGLVGFFSHVKK